VIGTFIIVALLTFKNRILQRARRLREPRYLIGAIAGAAYFWFFYLRSAHKSSRVLSGNISFMPVVVDVASMVVLVMMITAWALPGDSGGLEFTDAEIAFLFPAPLRRRDLLLYKILRAQPQLIFSVLIMTIIGMRRGYFVGTWIAFSAMAIYFTLVSLGRARLRLAHVGFVARLAGVVLILGALYALARNQVRSIAPPKGYVLESFNSLKGIPVSFFNAFFHEPLIAGILFIPRLFASAAIPATLASLAVSSLAVAALGVAFFYIAVALNVSFQEASIGASQRRAARQDRMRSQRVGSFVMFRRAPAPFRLGETGPVEVAIIWKNLIALMRNSIAWVVIFAMMIVFMVALALWTHETKAYLIIGTLLLFMSGLFPLLGPTIFSNDLRLDMPRLEVLKSYPISGERLVGAEIAAPLAVISILEMLFATSASVLVGMSGQAKGLLQYTGTPQFIVAILLLTLPVCAIQLIIRNAVPVLFPGWAVRSKEEPRGFVMMGQRLVTMAGNILVLAIALLPAAIVFLPSLWVAHRFFADNPAFVAVATMPAVGVLVAEAWFGVKALGAQFETIDVSNEMDVLAA
jgi:ABC-2 type transport system permease protein